uniref:Uncharacterized protein n=1 Tax=Rhizophora mucronata TaxID=61149 RepID=A0A2P2QSF3_RHIMU
MNLKGNPSAFRLNPPSCMKPVSNEWFLKPPCKQIYHIVPCNKGAPYIYVHIMFHAHDFGLLNSSSSGFTAFFSHF